METPALPTHIKKVAACAHFVRSGARGTEAAPATPDRYTPSPQRSEETSERKGNDNRSEPFGETGLIKSSVGDLKHHRNDFRLGGLDFKTVQEKEHVHGHKTNSLVPVQERVVFDEAEAITGSEGAEV